MLYADDAKIYRIVSTPLQALLLQKDLDRLHAWAMRNGLNINLSKCNIISFSRQPTTFEFEYSTDSQVLPRVDSIRDLGVVYDSTLKFDEHINK